MGVLTHHLFCPSDTTAANLCVCLCHRYYTVNPEGIGFGALISWAGSFVDGILMGGGHRGTGDNGDSDSANLRSDSTRHMTTIVQDVQKNVHYRWNNAEPLLLRYADLLKVAGVVLDAPSGYYAGVYHGNEVMMKFEKSLPPRIKGVALNLEVTFFNFGHADKAKHHYWDGTHEVMCIITVRRQGLGYVWQSLETLGNSDRTNLDAKRRLETMYGGIGLGYRPDGSPRDIEFERRFNDLQMAGIEVRFYSLPGKIGRFSYQLVMTQLLQGVVLLGVATSITRYFASYAFKNDGHGTSQAFRNYQCTPVLVKRAIARTAAKAALETHAFFASLDTGLTGVMSRARLFQNLQVAIGNPNQDAASQEANNERLTDAQIAQVVQDVCATANGAHSGFVNTNDEAQDDTIDHEDAVHLDEFTHLVGSDETNVLDLLAVYRQRPGNENFLKVLIDEMKQEDVHILEQTSERTRRKRTTKKSKARSRRDSRDDLGVSSVDSGTPLEATASPTGVGGVLNLDQYDFSDEGISQVPMEVLMMVASSSPPDSEDTGVVRGANATVQVQQL